MPAGLQALGSPLAVLSPQTLPLTLGGRRGVERSDLATQLPYYPPPGDQELP